MICVKSHQNETLKNGKFNEEIIKKKERKKMKFTKCWRRPPAVWTIWVVGRPPALRRLRQHNCPAVVVMMMMMMLRRRLVKIVMMQMMRWMMRMVRMVVLVMMLVVMVVVVACKFRRNQSEEILH